MLTVCKIVKCSFSGWFIAMWNSYSTGICNVLYSLYQKFLEKERMNYNSPNSLILWANGRIYCCILGYIAASLDILLHPSNSPWIYYCIHTIVQIRSFCERMEGYIAASFLRSQNELIWTIVIHSHFFHEFLLQTILGFKNRHSICKIWCFYEANF